ncbi:MAG: hypothetical protein M1274_00350 [Actinobacteria bacterium]|nr:hypothetical protein [Actinomycetota bacterium]
MSEAAITEVLRGDGPLTGAELQELTDMEPLALWRFCVSDARIEMRIVGHRYLRLDRAVDGYARLSPSIRREFLTYTLFDRAGIPDRLDVRAQGLAAEIKRISEAKRRLATQTISTLVEGLPVRDEVIAKACFILGGDIAYDMAHRVPRPEHSTGKLVRGSDLDLVVVTENSFEPEARTILDDAIYHKKHLLLISPSYREELDYLIKDMATVNVQLAFDTFEHMVACKILDEGEYLYGSPELFRSIKDSLRKQGILEKLESLGRQATANRAQAERILREPGGEERGSSYLNLFYPSDESEEIY